MTVAMAHDPNLPNETPADHWRQLAQKAITEAQQTVDPHVERVLRALADEYLATAEKIENERSKKVG
jgi:hypothetical protein